MSAVLSLKSGAVRSHNRVAAVMQHIPWYSFQGQARLAFEAGVSRSSISRLLSGKSIPSSPVACSVLVALEKRLGKPLDIRELFSITGTFPTAVCELCGCKGCLPSQAFSDDDTVQRQYRSLKPGRWEHSVQAHAASSESTVHKRTPKRTREDI